MDHFSGTSITHPVVACADEVEASLKAVADVDPGFMTVPEQRAALTALTRLGSQLEALRLRVLDSAGEVATTEGCRDVAAWLVARQRQDRASAGAAQRLAEALRGRWSHTGTAVAVGEVSIAQARVITRALDRIADADRETQAEGGTGLAPDVLAGAEAELVRLAADLRPRELERCGEKILTIVAPHVAEEHERRALERAERRAAAATRLGMRRRGDGSTDLKVRIPDRVASRLDTYLDAYTSPRTTAGPGGSMIDEATGDRISYERLRGEAFCSLLESIDPAAMPLHGGTATSVVVTIDEDQLRQGLGAAATEDGTRISPGELRRMACTAGIIPAVLGGRSQVLDLGRARRLFTGNQKLAMAIQHPTCRAQGCTVPATWCEAHHATKPWSRGGRTDLADGQLLCRWHHQRAHDDRYLVSRTANGDVRYHRRR